MRFPITLCLALLFFSSVSRSQTHLEQILFPGQSQISSGMGISWIDGTSYYMIGILPDLSFGNLNLDLDLTLRMNSADGTIRRIDWSNGAYRRIISHVSWGEKRDPVFATIGQLYKATLGHGFIMYDYDNSPSYDNRTIGGELDLNFSNFGIETMYGDIHEPGVMGGRLFVRPFGIVGGDRIPILGGLELGGTYVRDQNPNSEVVLVGSGTVSPQADDLRESKGRFSEYGFDAGVPIIVTDKLTSVFYYDYAKMEDFGHGSGIGIMGNLNGGGRISVSAKLERQFSGPRFIPEYFDHFYELERYAPGDTAGDGSKAVALDSTNASDGWFGELKISFMTSFWIVGSFRSVDDNRAGSLIHVEAQFPDIIPELALSAGYDRFGTLSFSDILTLNEKSLLYAFFGYKPYPFMTFGLNYFWTYSLVDGNFKAQKRMEPSVMVNFSF